MKISLPVEIVVISMLIFSLYLIAISFGQYVMKSSEATPFRWSILMRCRSLESLQYPQHASLPNVLFAFKSVAK